MRRGKRNRETVTTPLVGRVRGCFDNELSVRRHLFEDAVTICDIETAEPPEVAPGCLATLQIGGQAFDVSGVIDWLTPFADQRGFTYYLHHHDNIVVEVALFKPYQRAAFYRCLRLFRTRPAAEGGSNLLGVVDPGQAWILVLENDNQGGFRSEFFGPADMCRSLRSHLEVP